MFFIFISVSISVSADHVHSSAQPQLDILSIHSYHQDYSWTLLQYQAFKKQLAKNMPEHKLNFLSEYLDTKHIPPSAYYQKIFLQYLNAKYQNHLPDVIYATDDNALNFIISNLNEYTWKIPVVYSGINNTKVKNMQLTFPLMGVFEQKDVDASITLAKKIKPDLSGIVFVGDGGVTDIEIRASINNKKDHEINIGYIINSDLDSIIHQLMLYKNAVVLLTSIGGIRDSQGNLLSLARVINRIAKTGKIVLVMEDSYLLPGVLGGYITTGHMQGEMAANIFTKYHQYQVTAIAKQKNSELILSWPELQHLKINLQANFLKQAKIINQPKVLESEYSILMKLLLFFVLLLLGILLFTVIKTQHKNRVLRQQNTDELTGIPNRIRLLYDIEKIKAPQLIVIDINNFKSINNLYGLMVGDELLKTFAQKIKKSLSEEYSLYRIGGNKFAILNNSNFSSQQFDTYILVYLNNIQNRSYHTEKLDISLTLTAGISRNNQDFLIPMAEQALQRAKDDNKAYAICDVHKENANQHHKNLIWANKLTSALADDRIVPYFQVITHNKTGKQDKFESLVRLIDEDGNVISPFFFLEAAKSTRQYASLTKIMIEKTFRAMENKANSVSINFTVNDIRNEKTIVFFIAKLKEYQLGDRIIVELTESEGIENYNEVSEFIKNIKQMGCRVAIDDFGTGYSNFTHLIHLDVDYLKIDGSIINNIIKDKNSEIVVKTLVEFAAQLGIETIAEYVDSQQILDKVTELGIDYSQGFFLGRPKDAIST